MVSDVCPPFEVTFEKGDDHITPEKTRMLGCSPNQSVAQQRPKRTAKPFVRGNIESDLRAGNHRFRQFVSHELLQQNLLSRALDF